MLRHTRTLGIVQVDESVWKHLTKEERAEIAAICDEKLNGYFELRGKKSPLTLP